MPVINRIAELGDEMRAWRRDLHRHPETAFEEERTAGFVAEHLASWGIEVHRGLARTGVVGLLRGRGQGHRLIGLRADMDALPLQELNRFEHRSVHDGRMHACGHDGHTAMLLGAARCLAQTRNFAGAVAFIFQPAEENEGGGRVMVEEGLFDKFPVEAVYGLHNMPGLPAGHFACRTGPALASFDTFEIAIAGSGAHAAMPHHGADTIVAGAQIVGALQTIASRRTDPLESVVVSVTQFHAGETWNVLPERAVIRGTARAFSEAVQAQVEADLRRIAEGVAASQGAAATLDYERRYPVLVNSPRESAFAAQAAADIAGERAVRRASPPLMGAEDFAFMLKEKPGCYIWLGNGDGPGACPVHNPRYDFNDEILAVGASYWVRLVEAAMPVQTRTI